MPTVSLVPNLAADKSYLIFTDGPFKLTSLVISIAASSKSFSALPLGVNTPLVMGRDYFPGLLFNSATAELGTPVYGAVSFVDPALAGTVTYSFSALDSAYQATGAQISQALSDNTFDPLISHWEDLAVTAAVFPQSTIFPNASVLSGIADVNAAIADMQSEAVASQSAKSIFDFDQHINDLNNPHNTVASVLGLSHVPNWSAGSPASVIAGGSTSEFVTPQSVSSAVVDVVPTASKTKAGLLQLNTGTDPGDGGNQTDGLTAAGLLYLLSNGLLSTGATVIDCALQKVTFSPFPIVYPATWQGTVCNNFQELVQAVVASTGIINLTAHPVEGAIYFPHAVTVPDLTLS